MKIKLETKDIIVIIVIIFAAIVAGGLSVYQYIDGIKTEREAKTLQHKVITTQEKLIRAQENADKKSAEMNAKLSEANTELQLKTQQLLKSQEEVIKIQEESLKNITGSGFSEVHIQPLDENNFRFYIKSKSNYNMFNLLIEIVDFDGMKKCDYQFVANKYTFPEGCLAKNSDRNTMRTLNSNSYADLNYKFDTNRKRSHLIIKVVADNITTIQYSIIFHDKASKIFKHHFKLFEVTRDKKEYILISQSKENLPDIEWLNNFPYKMEMKVD